MPVTTPDLPSFRALARDRRVVPVTRTLLADGITAVGLFELLCGDRAGTFLLESAEAGRSWSRYSFVGVRSAAMLTDQAGEVRWFGNVPAGLPVVGSAWQALRDCVDLLHTPDDFVPGAPAFTSGFVGYLSYDIVRRFEKLPDDNPSPVDIPDMAFLLTTDMVVLDHFRGTVTLIANAINFDATDERVDEAWHDSVRRLEDMEHALGGSGAIAASRVTAVDDPPVHSHTPRERYIASVEQAKEYIRAGDAFQIVLSQRYSIDTKARALDIYRVLRSSNPSPYMYLIRLPKVATHNSSSDGSAIGTTSALSQEVGFEIVGSSPEALVTVRDRRCTAHPIAGTRPRGSDPDHDARLAADLLADDKERAEHVMLVDLARNDLGRVCDPGSIDVTEFMQIERYSHVMHIVSTVVGRLKEGAHALDALRSTFPAGTLSGAPKVRAMEIIDELEPTRRGLYGGAVGYVDFSGNLDVAIAIRTALVHGGVAHVQAGAGIVADSDPMSEDRECANKAGAVLRAVATASALVSIAREQA